MAKVSVTVTGVDAALRGINRDLQEQRLPALSSELARSLLRGAQAESGWPVLTGASRRGFFVTESGRFDFQLRNREEYAEHVEDGIAGHGMRADGGRFVERWTDDNFPRVLQRAIEQVFRDI